MKLDYPKEWFLRSAEIEGEAEVGAGLPPLAPGGPVSGSRLAFGHFVELWRRHRGWNAEQLAEAAGLDPGEILEIEHDPQAAPEPDAVYKLAQVFGVPAKSLYVVAGLLEPRTPQLQEKAVRFAARSERIAALEPHELEALEAFVSALGETGSPS